MQFQGILAVSLLEKRRKENSIIELGILFSNKKKMKNILKRKPRL